MRFAVPFEPHDLGLRESVRSHRGEMGEHRPDEQVDMALGYVYGRAG
jgi:hypothetical protein